MKVRMSWLDQPSVIMRYFWYGMLYVVCHMSEIIPLFSCKNGFVKGFDSMV